jgi:peptidoglycan LD-endopeptidase CwlK
MPKYGRRSENNLHECHEDLILLFSMVIEVYDCSIIEAVRERFEQDKLFHAGKSQVQWPDSKHNVWEEGLIHPRTDEELEPQPRSRALDAVPYPIDWNNTKRFYHFAGIVEGIASGLGIDIIWGGDWTMDNDFKDQSFHDLPHFELVGEG